MVKASPTLEIVTNIFAMTTTEIKLHLQTAMYLLDVCALTHIPVYFPYHFYFAAIILHSIQGNKFC
jgi:hypothetical protein